MFFSFSRSFSAVKNAVIPKTIIAQRIIAAMKERGFIFENLTGPPITNSIKNITKLRDSKDSGEELIFRTKTRSKIAHNAILTGTSISIGNLTYIVKITNAKMSTVITISEMLSIF